MFSGLSYTFESLSAFLLAFIPGVFNLGLAAYVFYKMPFRLLINLFILILVTSACWQFANAFMRISANAETARFWDGFFSPIGLFATPLLLHFALVYTDKIKQSIWKYGIYILYFSLFVFTNLYGYVHTNVSYAFSDYWGWMNIRDDKLYVAIVGGLVVIFMLANVLLQLSVLRKIKKDTNKYKSLLLISSSLFLVVFQVAITEVSFPLIFNLPPTPITPTIMLAYSLATYVALTRYNFFRGEESINKTGLLNSVSDIIIVVNNALDISYVNKAGLEQIGTTPEETGGIHITNILGCENLENDEIKQKLIELSKLPPGTEMPRCNLRARNGAVVPVLIRVSNIQGDTNSTGYLLLCRNISDVEIAQEETRRNDRRFRKIIERAKDAMAIIDTEGRIIYSSPSVLNVMGYTPAELEGNSFMRYVHLDFQLQAAKDFEENFTTAQVKESTVKVIHKSGKEIWLETVAVNYFDDPDVNGLVAVFRDITKRTKLLDSTYIFGLMNSNSKKLSKMKDPYLNLSRNLYTEYQALDSVQTNYKVQLDALLPRYVDARMAALGQQFIPDANSTMRLTYGYIKGYEPADAIYYTPQTSVSGMIEKAGQSPDYELNERLAYVYSNKKDNTYYSPKLNDVPSCMLYNTDTSGGNSGSPVLNKYGQLIGLNFDRAFEATVNDYAWDDAYSRSIGLDIRFVLWTTQEVAGAKYLINEMFIDKGK